MLVRVLYEFSWGPFRFRDSPLKQQLVHRIEHHPTKRVHEKSRTLAGSSWGGWYEISRQIEDEVRLVKMSVGHPSQEADKSSVCLGPILVRDLCHLRHMARPNQCKFGAYCLQSGPTTPLEGITTMRSPYRSRSGHEWCGVDGRVTVSPHPAPCIRREHHPPRHDHFLLAHKPVFPVPQIEIPSVSISGRIHAESKNPT